MIKKLILVLKNLKASHENAKMNRILAGTDRYGNKYYQYFDDSGRESRRIMEPNPYASEPFDPLWTEWLRNRQKKPFNEKELKCFYDEETTKTKQVYEYEIKDAEIMSEFRKEYKKSQENEKNKINNSFKKDYGPGEWKPERVNNSDLKK